MDFREKKLYHQIHPVKLFTDWSTAFIALYFFWIHNLLIALLITFIPAILVSLLIVRYVDLKPYKYSACGRYLTTYMTPLQEFVRLLGMIPMLLGAWYHILWLIPLGIVITLFGWFQGLLFPKAPVRL